MKAMYRSTIVGVALAGAGVGLAWSAERGNAFRREITNPFKLPEVVGVRYSGHESVTAGHLLTMQRNRLEQTGAIKRFMV